MGNETTPDFFADSDQKLLGVVAQLEDSLAMPAAKRDFLTATSVCMATREAWLRFHESFLIDSKNLPLDFSRMKNLLRKAHSAVANTTEFRPDNLSDRQVVEKYATSIRQRFRLVEALERGGIEAVKDRLDQLVGHSLEETTDQSTPDKHTRPCGVRLAFLSDEHYRWLLEDPSRLFSLSYGEFEELVADRLHAMGYEVKLVGKPNAPDGGVDIVAWPRFDVPFRYILAAQVKHHNEDRSTSVGTVRDFYGTLTM